MLQITEPLNTEKLHLALGQAINDLIRAKNDKRYDIDMSAWHEPQPNGLCYVCLAGATLYRNGYGPGDDCEVLDCNDPVQNMGFVGLCMPLDEEGD